MEIIHLFYGFLINFISIFFITYYYVQSFLFCFFQHLIPTELSNYFILTDLSDMFSLQIDIAFIISIFLITPFLVYKIYQFCYPAFFQWENLNWFYFFTNFFIFQFICIYFFFFLFYEYHLFYLEPFFHSYKNGLNIYYEPKLICYLHFFFHLFCIYFFFFLFLFIFFFFCVQIRKIILPLLFLFGLLFSPFSFFQLIIFLTVSWFIVEFIFFFYHLKNSILTFK